MADKKIMVQVRQGEAIEEVERPSLMQTAWVLQQICEAMERRPSFRQFIYGILGYPRPEENTKEGTYVTLYLAGGMEVTNTLFNSTDERMAKLEELVKVTQAFRKTFTEAYKLGGEVDVSKVLSEHGKHFVNLMGLLEKFEEWERDPDSFTMGNQTPSKPLDGSTTL